MTDIRHFLDLDKMSASELKDILALGDSEKAGNAPFGAKPLAGKTLALIFEKPSTRTRVSFEVGMRQLGGDVVVLDADSSQLGRGETIADTARVLSRFVDAIMIRTTDESKLLEMAKYATVPVINGLTDQSHPCQIMADLMTIKEHKGTLEGLKFAWLGDGNNVSASFIHASPKFGFALDMACPAGYRPNQGLIESANAEGGKVQQFVRLDDGYLVEAKVQPGPVGGDTQRGPVHGEHGSRPSRRARLSTSRASAMSPPHKPPRTRSFSRRSVIWRVATKNSSGKSDRRDMFRSKERPGSPGSWTARTSPSRISL